jgi:hypothetical protein
MLWVGIEHDVMFITLDEHQTQIVISILIDYFISTSNPDLAPANHGNDQELMLS